MKELTIKTLGMVAVFRDFIKESLDGITAYDFLKQVAKATFYGALSLAVICAVYSWIVILACIS